MEVLDALFQTKDQELFYPLQQAPTVGHEVVEDVDAQVIPVLLYPMQEGQDQDRYRLAAVPHVQDTCSMGVM